jgi:hypothetical protein
MTDLNMHYASYIPEELVTAWIRELNLYEMQYKNTLFARNYLPNRDVGATVDYDTITYYNSPDRRAQFISKGSVPEPFAARAKTAKHEMYQIAEGFTVNERDLIKADGAAMKTKQIDIAIRNIHKAEDYAAMNGDGMDLLGIVAAAHGNSLGSITTATNNGAWAGTDSTRDPYEDINLACTYMESSFKPAKLVGTRADLALLNTMDSERRPFWKDIAELFGKSDTDKSWQLECQYCPSGYVYIIPYDPQAAEFVVSEEISIVDDYAKQPGGNFWIEIKEWVNPCEIHYPDAFCEIAIG